MLTAFTATWRFAARSSPSRAPIPIPGVNQPTSARLRPHGISIGSAPSHPSPTCTLIAVDPFKLRYERADRPLLVSKDLTLASTPSSFPTRDLSIISTSAVLERVWWPAWVCSTDSITCLISNISTQSIWEMSSEISLSLGGSSGSLDGVVHSPLVRSSSWLELRCRQVPLNSG
jgi:hypothetical protein